MVEKSEKPGIKNRQSASKNQKSVFISDASQHKDNTHINISDKNKKEQKTGLDSKSKNRMKSIESHTSRAHPIRSKPVSPHLQIWQWHATMLSSILHRATGIALYLGSIGLVLWLLALAKNGMAYRIAQTILASIPGQIMLIGFVYALIYHLLNGVRHLVWDMGAGFDIRQANRLSVFIIIISALLTLFLWFVALYVRGSLN